MCLGETQTDAECRPPLEKEHEVQSHGQWGLINSYRPDCLLLFPTVLSLRTTWSGLRLTEEDFPKIKSIKASPRHDPSRSQEDEFWRFTLRYIMLECSEQQGWRRDTPPPPSFQRENEDTYRKRNIRLVLDFSIEPRRLTDNKKCFLVPKGTLFSV